MVPSTLADVLSPEASPLAAFEALIRSLVALCREALRQQPGACQRLEEQMDALAFPWTPALLDLLEAYADDLAENERPREGPRAELVRFLLLDSYTSPAIRKLQAGAGSAPSAASFVRVAMALHPHLAAAADEGRGSAVARDVLREVAGRLGALGELRFAEIRGAREGDQGRTRLTLVPAGASLSQAIPGAGVWPTRPEIGEMVLVGRGTEPLRLRPFIEVRDERLFFLASTPRQPEPRYRALLADEGAELPEVPPETMAANSLPSPVDLAALREQRASALARIGQRSTATGASVVGGLADADVGQGAILGERFELGRELSRGTVGAVHEAREIETGEPVIVKVLVHRPDASRDAIQHARDSYVREAEALAAVSHAGLPRLLADGSRHDPPYIALEMASPGTLRDVLTPPRALPLPRVTFLVGQLADALSAVHAAGVVHRDVKPENVLVDASDHLVLIDFGLALCRAARGQVPPDIGGTLPYISPEAMDGQPVSSASDIFALGVILFECLTGRPLYEGRTRRDVADAIRKGQRAPAAAIDGPHRDDMYRLVKDCTHPDPRRRLADAGAARRRLVEAASPGAPRSGGWISRLLGRRSARAAPCRADV